MTAAAVFLASFLLYMRTAAATVWSGDSPELTTAAWAYGIAHPPGYPLYVISCKAWGWMMPFGSFALRSALFSSVTTAAAIGLLCLWAGRFGILPALAAASVAATGMLWSSATAAEVFGLHALTAAGLLFLLARPWHGRQAAGAGYLWGLAAGNHHSLVLLLPVGLWRLLEKSPVGTGRKLGGFLLFGLLGATITLFMPLRSRRQPLADWDNPENIPNFIRVITRGGYGGPAALSDTHRARYEIAAVPRSFVHWFRLQEERGWLLAGPFLSLSPAAWLSAAWLFTGPGFLFLGDPPAEQLPIFERFIAFSEIFAAAGIAAWLGWLAFHRAAAWPRTAAILLSLASMGLAGFSLRKRWDRMNRREAFFQRDHAADLISACPPGSQLFLEKADETIFAVMALRLVEGKRPDVKIHDVHASLLPHPYGDKFLRMSGRARRAHREPVERKMIQAHPGPSLYIQAPPAAWSGMAWEDVAPTVYQARLPGRPRVRSVPPELRRASARALPPAVRLDWRFPRLGQL